MWKQKEAIEAHLYQQERDLFGFDETITLHDLTNTFFQGAAKINSQAQRGALKKNSVIAL